MYTKYILENLFEIVTFAAKLVVLKAKYKMNVFIIEVYII